MRTLYRSIDDRIVLLFPDNADNYFHCCPGNCRNWNLINILIKKLNFTIKLGFPIKFADFNIKLFQYNLLMNYHTSVTNLDQVPKDHLYI